MEYLWMAFVKSVLQIWYLDLELDAHYFAIIKNILTLIDIVNNIPVDFYIIKKGREILFSDYAMVEEQVKMKLISYTDNTNHIPIQMSYVGRYDLLGLFRYNQGTKGLITEVTYNIGTYLIGIRTSIILLNEISCGSSISFKINDTYAGSGQVYYDCQQLQFHKLRLVQIDILKLYQSYTNCQAYYLFLLLDIPQYQFTLSIVGNYMQYLIKISTDLSATWAYEQIILTSGYCPDNCQLCELPNECKICYPTFYKYRDGQCILCTAPYQKLDGSYCKDYDDETSYSKYFIKEYYDLTIDPNQFSQYTLISKNGINFMKGSDILYSIHYGTNLIFGGELVWAQAKFSRVHKIIKPHHSITIGFYILFGPSFPQDRSNNPVITFKGSSQTKRVYERIQHQSSSLTIQWECYGSNNEPKNAYCGFYNYYILKIKKNLKQLNFFGFQQLIIKNRFLKCKKINKKIIRLNKNFTIIILIKYINLKYYWMSKDIIILILKLMSIFKVSLLNK
ncbi:unnamed protein product [Paramecium pentaurelia]|uniref:Uncharacterized protein n=1 Tax=Paramecium pentaurelia TaxID=43138 RepID=A0A8S1U1C2_9CILI|nr:unnamed protein product [Paramecium pentaurelia]